MNAVADNKFYRPYDFSTVSNKILNEFKLCYLVCCTYYDYRTRFDDEEYGRLIVGPKNTEMTISCPVQCDNTLTTRSSRTTEAIRLFHQMEIQDWASISGAALNTEVKKKKKDKKIFFSKLRTNLKKKINKLAWKI